MTDKDEKTYVNWNTDELVDAKKFGEVWVPMKVIRKSGLRSSGPGYTQRTYEVDQFTLDKPAPERFIITIPPGARVIDQIHHDIYDLKDDGSKKFLDFYDPATRKVVSATQQAAQEAAATQPATLP